MRAVIDNKRTWNIAGTKREQSGNAPNSSKQTILAHPLPPAAPLGVSARLIHVYILFHSNHQHFFQSPRFCHPHPGKSLELFTFAPPGGIYIKISKPMGAIPK